jgi:hypothetical protein
MEDVANHKAIMTTFAFGSTCNLFLLRTQHIVLRQILERNWDKSLKSFPPCYSVTSTNGFYSPPPPAQTKLV